VLWRPPLRPESISIGLRAGAGRAAGVRRRHHRQTRPPPQPLRPEPRAAISTRPTRAAPIRTTATASRATSACGSRGEVKTASRRRGGCVDGTSVGRPALKQILIAALRHPAGAGEVALPGAARTPGPPCRIKAQNNSGKLPSSRPPQPRRRASAGTLSHAARRRRRGRKLLERWIQLFARLFREGKAFPLLYRKDARSQGCNDREPRPVASPFVFDRLLRAFGSFDSLSSARLDDCAVAYHNGNQRITCKLAGCVGSLPLPGLLTRWRVIGAAVSLLF
jgi:hypothetical protein